ncbi:MAG: hypothetical protein M3282_09170, partial [Gemmatimonadota bacterium]|nr:hypothetical protein [Gemmatimonadota bacterium]
MTQRTLWALTALTLATAAVGLPAQEPSRSRDTFNWAGQVPAGRWITVRNLNGEIRVEPATGNRVEVTAVKTWRRGDPADVRIEVKKYGPGEQDVLICALWSETAHCDEDGYRDRGSGRNRRDNDVSVEFRVKVPRGVKIGAGSVNGSVTVDGATSEVKVGTVNGSVEATSTGGPVEASTVNGSVFARMGRLTGTEDLNYSTVNGSIEVEFDGELTDADVEMSTV